MQIGCSFCKEIRYGLYFKNCKSNLELSNTVDDELTLIYKNVKKVFGL
jgi:hypothetical protein